jgi:hypothetical protein
MAKKTQKKTQKIEKYPKKLRLNKQKDENLSLCLSAYFC